MNRKQEDLPYHITGWVLFLICAVLFLYVAARDRDLALTLASLVFLSGCIAFLIPLMFPTLIGRRVKAREKDSCQDEIS